MKKILSLLITAAMIVAMLPNVFATETAPEVGTEFTYLFGKNALLDPTKELDSNYLVADSSILDPEKTEPWTYVGCFDRVTTPSWNEVYVRHILNPHNSARFAFKLTIPYAGKYDINIAQTEIYNNTGFKKNTNGKGCYINGATDIYIFPSSTEDLTLRSWTPGTKEKVTTFRHFKENSVSTKFEFETAGIYYFLFNLDMDNAAFVEFYTANGITLDDGNAASSSKNEIKRVYCDLGSITLTYQGAIETEEPGPDEPALEDISGKINYEEKDHAGEDTASIKAFKVLGENGEITASNIITDGIPTDITFGDVCEDITAPDAPKGYKFLYWAKGNSERKQILSFTETLSDFRPNEGVNYLMAVYEAENGGEDVAKFYNANGQLLDLEIEGSKLPPYPSMPGYGKARAWALKNPDGTYTEYTEAVPENTSGTMIFMAVYDDLEASITVTVDGDERKVKYGDPVKCVLKGSDEGEFMYWTKEVNGVSEIVSIDSDYTFLAFCNCEVKSVFGSGIEELSKKMRKIILTGFVAGEERAVMAEFIGCEDAIEKGIMFGNKRVPMSTAGTQFAVIDDTVGKDTATGYAIIREGEALKIVTDGSVSIGKEVE